MSQSSLPSSSSSADVQTLKAYLQELHDEGLRESPLKHLQEVLTEYFTSLSGYETSNIDMETTTTTTNPTSASPLFSSEKQGMDESLPSFADCDSLSQPLSSLPIFDDSFFYEWNESSSTIPPLTPTAPPEYTPQHSFEERFVNNLHHTTPAVESHSESKRRRLLPPISIPTNHVSTPSYTGYTPVNSPRPLPVLKPRTIEILKHVKGLAEEEDADQYSAFLSGVQHIGARLSACPCPICHEEEEEEEGEEEEEEDKRR
jgi:hypothetical protein